MMVPPFRLIAPATPAPIPRWLFAALTMASTSYSVMSPRSRMTSVGPTLTFIAPLLRPPGLVRASGYPRRVRRPCDRGRPGSERRRSSGGSAAFLGLGLHPQTFHLLEGQGAELAAA